MSKQLLSVVEMGGYPDFSPIYQQSGFEVTLLTQMRKVLKHLKKHQPDVIVAEFNFQSDFRDRTSSLESMMSLVQKMSNTKVIIFYDKEFSEPFSRLQARFEFHQVMTFPIDEAELALKIKELVR